MTETHQAAAVATRAVMSRLRGMLPDDVPPFSVLHGAECALSYHLRDGLTVDMACWKAAKANMGFEAMPCGWCGEQFLSQRGEEFCTVHCWVQDRTLRDPDTDVTGCGDDCDHCAGDTKVRRPDWLGLDRLEMVGALHAITHTELEDLARRLPGDGVGITTDEEECLIELAVRLGPDRATVLLGNRQAILGHLEAIEGQGYDLTDALQDFIDGRA